MNQEGLVAETDHFYPLLSREYIDYLTNQIVRKKIRGRELFTRSKVEVHFRALYQNNIQEMRWLPEGIKFDTDMLIFEHKLILFSYKAAPHAISIEGSSIIDTHKIMFDLLWQATPRIKE